MSEVRRLGRWAALALVVVASCVDTTEGTGSVVQRASTCPEAVRISSRGEPIGVVSGHIRWCWPGEASCYCDSDNDCYRLDGYVACTPPAPDAGSDAGGDAAADRTDATADATADVAADVAADRADASDATADVAVDVAVDVAADVAADRADAAADAAADAGLRYCPEAVFVSSRGEPIGVVSGHIRWCWPGEASCYCDSDNDCYRQSGYVACTPPPADAGTDAAADRADTGLDANADAAVDVAVDRADAADAADAGPALCPGVSRIDSSGVPRDTVTGKVRWCWPGERRCYCDLDNDCYRQDGYVACTPRASDAGVTTPAEPGTAPDTSTLPLDTVTYTGTFPAGAGYRLVQLGVAGLTRYVWLYVPRNRTARPPLVLAFHGATLNGEHMMREMDGQWFAETYGVVVAAPTARYMNASQADFNRPFGEAVYWQSQLDPNPNTNNDLLLARAIMAEARRVYGADADRTYAVGFSNGGFMALTTSVVLRDRVAAFAEHSSGLVTCQYRADCGFTGRSLTCEGLRAEPGWCACSGSEKPIALPPTGARPGFLWHGAQDTVVSVQYTCTLAARLQALGVPSQTVLWNGDHAVSPSFIGAAWPFLSSYRRQ